MKQVIKPLLLGGLALTVIVFATDKAIDSPAAYVSPTPIEVDVGLTHAEAEELWYISHRGVLVDIPLLKALKDKDTGDSVLDSMHRFGFLPAPASHKNPFGLPIGLVLEEMEPGQETSVPFAGLNCSACHTSEMSVAGQAYRVDGGSNLIELEGWLLHVFESGQHAATNPFRLMGFVWRYMREVKRARAIMDNRDEKGLREQFPLMPLDNDGGGREALLQAVLKSGAVQPELNDDDLQREWDRLAADPSSVPMEPFVLAEPDADAEFERVLAGSDDDLLTLQREKGGGRGDPLALRRGDMLRYLRLLYQRTAYAYRAYRLVGGSPVAGPGRDDPWNLIRANLLKDKDVVLDTPVNVPPLFNLGKYEKFHIDGNTNTIIERNLAPGIAFGAKLYPDGSTNLNIRNIHRTEQLYSKTHAPKWPFGNLDADKVARGKEIFYGRNWRYAGGVSTCAGCHEKEYNGNYDIAAIGTERKRYDSFVGVISNGKTFADQMDRLARSIKLASFQRANIPKREWSQWVPANPDWMENDGYLARSLRGIWATPPYLHNGSVMNLYELLLPVDQRRQRFNLGSREYDTRHVGYKDQPGEIPYILDTTEEGNSNAGHEFGAEPNEDERWALVEYLKSRS